MKNLIKRAALMLMMFVSLSTFAQQGYTISFDQTMETEDSTMQQTIDMMGDVTSTWYSQGDNFRSETNAGMAGVTTVVYNGSNQEILLLMENPFSGNMYSSIKDTTDTDQEKPFTVVKTKEKRKIAGYKCVKYVITDTAGVVTTAYATNSIKSPSYSQYGDKVEGMVLCTISEMEAMGATLKVSLTANNVVRGTISDDKFSLVIPEGYTNMNEFVEE